MNKQQVEYVTGRLRNILREKQNQLFEIAKAKLPKPPAPVTYLDVHKAILSGKVKLNTRYDEDGYTLNNDRFLPSVGDMYDLSPIRPTDNHVKVEKDPTYKAQCAVLVEEYNKCLDSVMLGNEKDALALIEQFAKA